MSRQPDQQKRTPLSPARVLEAAVELADEIGIDDLTIRRLAEALQVKPMSIYHHVPNKEAIINGMVDLVFAEIDLPPVDLDWSSAMRARSHSMRSVLARHPWAAPLMESRDSPGMATLAHHDAVLGCLRNGGLSLSLTGHAYALIDAYIYGFALQEATMPATGGQEMTELASNIVDHMPESAFPHLAEFAADHVGQPGYDFRNEFDYGLSLILDGLLQAAADESHHG